MPLRQPPAEQPFRLIPPNWNPVSNDRVLPHLGLIDSDFYSGMLCQALSFTLSVRSEWNCIDRLKARAANSRAVKTTDFVTLTVTVFVV
jgi:hypothetical protein